MLSVALAGYKKGQEMKDHTDILESLNLSVLTIIIIVAASMTIFTSFLGLAGAYFRSMLVLKLVRQRQGDSKEAADDTCALACLLVACMRSLSLLPIVFFRLVQYIVLVLITFITQIAIGAYLLNLDMGGLRTSWEQDDDQGYNRRVTLQRYLTCCGFDVWSDSIGTLHTDCPNPPTYANGYTVPTACYKASQDYIDSWMHPIAVAAIVIGSIESLAMAITCVLVFRSKDRNSDTAFDY